MLRLFKIVAFILFTSYVSLAQSREFKVNFTDSCRDSDWNLISEIFDLSISEKVPFVGISAYVLHENIETKLFYRYKVENSWKPWQELKRFHESGTPGRTTFEGEPLKGPIDSIQFKSNEILDEAVVFRIFTPPAQKKKSGP